MSQYCYLKNVISFRNKRKCTSLILARNQFFIFFSQVTEWTDEDYAALAKAMAKFPGGTPGRWERIGHEVGRRADEVNSVIVRGVTKGPAII